MEVNIHHAKTNLSKLIAAAESGEEVIIARAGKPAVKLVIEAPPVRKSRKHLRGPGIGKIWMAPDAFSPETDLEIQKLFEADDPKFENLGPKPTLRKRSPNERAGRHSHLHLGHHPPDHRSSTKRKQICVPTEHELIFSLVSLWEIAIKIKTGKLNAIGSSVAYIRDEMEAYGMELLPIRYEHILQLESTPPSPRRPLRPPPHRPGHHRVPSPSSPPTKSSINTVPKRSGKAR